MKTIPSLHAPTHIHPTAATDTTTLGSGWLKKNEGTKNVKIQKNDLLPCL
jgi:hypothetical protein